MIDIKTVTGNRYVTTNTVNSKKSVSGSADTASTSRNADIFELTGDTEIQAEKSAAKKLSAADANALAEKYDVKNMTRNEYTSLLKDLRDLGAVTSKDFSTAYGGAVPYVGPTEPGEVWVTTGDKGCSGLEAWPTGSERADFTKLIRSCAVFCSNFASTREEDSEDYKSSSSFADSYRRLSSILDQIDKASKRLT